MDNMVDLAKAIQDLEKRCRRGEISDTAFQEEVSNIYDKYYDTPGISEAVLRDFFSSERYKQKIGFCNQSIP